jgi:hypothetical protein
LPREEDEAYKQPFYKNRFPEKGKPKRDINDVNAATSNKRDTAPGTVRRKDLEDRSKF